MGDVGNAINRGVSDLGNGMNRVRGGVSDAVGITNYSGERALDAQNRAADAANQTAKDIYNQQRADQEPWRQAGMSALSGIQDNKFMDNWQQDPGYQFRMDQGMKSINAAASARGQAGGGATMKALARYGQDYASGEYSKVYDRNYGRLSQLAGFGTNANATNNQNLGAYGSQVSGNQIGMGNAQASNQVAQSNRMGQFIQSGAQAGATYLASDRNLKENLQPIAKADLDEMRSHLKAYAFNYIDDKHGKGDWIGVMAQDLEKSKLGKELVIENEQGHKMIDVPRLLSMFLATMAEA